MSEKEKLEQYPHAMTIDSETGKPMPKVATVGGGGSDGSPMLFPEDFPDSELLEVTKQHAQDMLLLKQALNSLAADFLTVLTNQDVIIEELKKVTGGEVIFKVEQVNTEPEVE